MATILSTNAIEESTYIITATYTDQDGAAVTPNAGLNWTLTDDSGNIINERENVAIAVPSTSNSIVLSGDDLAVPTTVNRVRIFTVEGTYNSATYGNNLPIKAQCQFTIDDLTAVT
jgi:hypothetical protein